MKINYLLSQQYLRCVLLISLFLQSCGGSHNPPIQEEERGLIEIGSQLSIIEGEEKQEIGINNQVTQNINLFCLPSEILTHILSFVKYPDIIRAALTCRDLKLQVKYELCSMPIYLYDAIIEEDIKKINVLIKLGANIYAWNEDLVTPLNFAYLHNKPAIADRLRTKYYKAMTAESTPLDLAVVRGEKQEVINLIQNMYNHHDNDISNQLNKAFSLSAHECQLEIADILIGRGADINHKDKYDETPLHRATFNGQLNVAQLLIDRGAKVDARDTYGNTPLHRATFNGQLGIAKILVAHGATVDATNKYGSTPLHRAVFNGQVEISHFLISSKASMNLKDQYGNTPLHRIFSNKIRLAEMIDLFVNYDNDILTIENNDGKTPLELLMELPKVGYGHKNS